MTVIALVPHSVHIFPEDAFIGLEQINPTTWVADSVDDSKLIAEFPSKGNARIATTTENAESVEGIPAVKTVYGELTGVDVDVNSGDLLIVSLPTQSMAVASRHPLAPQMVTPYKVVRLRSNTSTVLGCMGLSFQ